MAKLQLIQDPRMKEKFSSYPQHIKTKLDSLRALILESAEEHPGISGMEETLKWGEPSYLVKKGSTVRIDWKVKTPDQYAIYFKCTSRLVETFRAVYGDTFDYEKNRAILFSLDDEVPKIALKKCITAALRYHHVKNEPLLGMDEE